MSKDPAILFYSQDFIVGTMFMTNEQAGIYIRLLCSQHQHGGIIEKSSFNVLCGENDIVRTKFVETDDGFFNERLANEMMKRSIKSTNMSEVAKKRWKSNAIAMQSHSKSNAVLMLTEDEDEGIKNNHSYREKQFELLWAKYPNKDGRKLALKHFKASVNKEEDFEDINKALGNYLASERVSKGYIKNGSTWFNNWRDWVTGVTKESEFEL